MTTIDTLVKTLSDKLDATHPHLVRLDRYWHGDQPAAFLAPEAAEAMGNRLTHLAVNFPRLAVTALTERLAITGFRTAGPDSAPDDALWGLWRGTGMVQGSAEAHTDALVYGRSFALVWADAGGRPTVTIESPRQVAVTRDPITRQVTAALKRWVDAGKAHAVLYLPTEIIVLDHAGNQVDPVAIPSTGWTVTETIPNPLGVVPMVPIVNRGRLLDVDGVSEMADVLHLTDAVSKLTQDMMVTSEFYARPRRWATGLEIVEDDQGNPVKPFSASLDDLWQSEAPETKFGQFDTARLDGYADAVALITQQVGAITGLPPHYLGLHGDQPASADAIRSAEASLVARCYALHRAFGGAWAEVAKLMLAVRDGSDPHTLDVETVWGNPETRTPAQAADAAAKLVGVGVPLSIVLADTLGYTPDQVDRVRQARRGDALDVAGVDLGKLLAS